MDGRSSYADSSIFVRGTACSGPGSYGHGSSSRGYQHSGTRELVRNGKTGFLFVPGDSKQLAGCIKKLVNDEALRVQMGQSAKQYVATNGLTIQQIARRHINLYEQALVRDLRGVCR